jgi:steroid delta-isomerase-like uncharacterized protein
VHRPNGIERLQDQQSEAPIDNITTIRGHMLAAYSLMCWLSTGETIVGAKMFAVSPRVDKWLYSPGMRTLIHSELAAILGSLCRGGTMSGTNRAVVERWWQELWNKGELGAADAIISPTYTNHDPASPWVPSGIEGCKTLVAGYRTVFPDINFVIKEEVVGDNRVVSHWICKGTHRAELMGIAATGKQMQVEGISILHLKDGKITHQTTIWDALGMMQQLGAVPSTTATA